MNSTYSNKKFIIDTNQAPRAIGPYSQGVTFGGLLFVSGQIPVDPHSGEIIQGGVEAQTRQVMNNLQAVLMAAGLDFSHVLKTTVFLRNMNDYTMMNDVYGLYFDYSPPARACVEVSRLPKDVLVEIECIAAAPTDYESRVEDSLDTDADHPEPDDWEQRHIAEANAAHAGLAEHDEPVEEEEDEVDEEVEDSEEEVAADDEGEDDAHDPSIAEDLADAVDAEASEPAIDEEEELSALDALDALQDGDGEEGEEVDEDDDDVDYEDEEEEEEDEVEDEVEELDESSVIEEDPLDIPSIPKIPGKEKSKRPSPPRLAKLKFPKRNGDEES